MSWKLNSDASLYDGYGFTIALQSTDRAAADVAISKLIETTKAKIQAAMLSLPELKRFHRLKSEQDAMRQEAERLNAQLTERASTRTQMLAAADVGLGRALALFDAQSESLTALLRATNPAALDSEIGDLTAVLMDRFKSISDAIIREQKREQLDKRQKLLDRLIATVAPILTEASPLSGFVLLMELKGLGLTFNECIKTPAALAAIFSSEDVDTLAG